ncbi:MAG: hypothetical protein K1X81_07785 [Bacteroidia bacterium]|nr:hypothetical protein [Bacteroidia bacterium]
MSHIKLLLLLASLSCLSLHCKKEEDEINKLPPATSCGAGTFGCLINGKAWPMGKDGYHYIQAEFSNGVLDIGYYIKDDFNNFFDREWVHLAPKQIDKAGVNIFQMKEISKGFFSVRSNGNAYFSVDPINENEWASVTIFRIDSINRIASGAFDFSLYNEEGTKKIKVSSGRFDFHY